MSSTARVLVENEGGNKHYPSPLASHEDIVKDPSLFWSSLRIFHSLLGTKFKVPVFGGKEINFHVLYVEVTKKGGYEKVVSEKKWTEVGYVFNFSATATSVSYALRNHYHSFLYHFEQVYFFKLQGPLRAPAGPLHFKAIGTIEGKFDCGYLVSVKLGSKLLNGVLYHSERKMSSTVITPGGNEVGDKCYPAPLASHDDIVKDPSLFWRSLKNFHSVLGTKYMVPVCGGNSLDLHFLYVEVTKIGGYDKVVSEKKWREIGSVFNFSATTPCASYALRNHYHRFLYHFEQVYFFKLQGPLPAPTGPLCFKATGTIDGKFDCGYLVSVKLGSETLNGVLYHSEQPCTAIILPFTPNPQRAGRKSRRKRKRGGDPNHPKSNRSGYNFFFAEKHSSFKSLYPERKREFAKLIGESWNNLTQEEKMVYQSYALKDKERYQREMMEYKETMKMRQSRDEA